VVVGQKKGSDPARSSKKWEVAESSQWKVLTVVCHRQMIAGRSLSMSCGVFHVVAPVALKVVLHGDGGGEVGLDGYCYRGPLLKPTFACEEMGPRLRQVSGPGRGEGGESLERGPGRCARRCVWYARRAFG